MMRGTTPTLTFSVPVATNTISVIYITFNQEGNTILEKNISNVTMGNMEVTLYLSQADTLLFKADRTVEIQLRIKTTDGKVMASNIIRTSVGRILKNEQI